MDILAVGTALPRHRYQQSELLDLLSQLWKHSPRAQKHLHKLHSAVQVDERYLAMPREAYEQLSSFTEANSTFLTTGTQLGAEALTQAATNAGVGLAQLDALFFTTVTGLGVPTIDAKLINQLRLRPDIRRTPLFGLGCLAGAAGMARMYDYLLAYPDHTAALLSVELCSLTLQRDDVSIANFIASGLFGDGAAAVIACGRNVAARARPQARLRVEATRSAFYYDTEDVMGWDIGTSGFKIVLSAEVPAIVSRYLVEDVTRFLREHSLKVMDIETWICHSGGPKVLQAIEAGFGLKNGELALTWKSLAAVGNLSSASVLFVLAETMKTKSAAAGTAALMVAMGPGFCSEMLLLKWL